MQARQFNSLYSVGSVFILKTALVESNGKPVRTVGKAVDSKGNDGAIVEINIEPWFANVKNLQPIN